MINTDEEMQNQFDHAGDVGDGIDAYAYKKVFDALKQEPDFRLPANFSDQVIAKLEAKRESSRDFIWFGLGIFSFVIATVVAVVLTDFRLNFGAFKFIAGYQGLIIFGIVFILALQWIDKRVIQKTLSGG